MVYCGPDVAGKGRNKNMILTQFYSGMSASVAHSNHSSSIRFLDCGFVGKELTT